MIKVHKINVTLESGRVIRLQNVKEFELFLSKAFGVTHTEDFDEVSIGKKLKLKNSNGVGYYPFTYELKERYYVSKYVVREYKDLVN